MGKRKTLKGNGGTKSVPSPWEIGTKGTWKKIHVLKNILEAVN